jgi:hypothetical protein
MQHSRARQGEVVRALAVVLNADRTAPESTRGALENEGLEDLAWLLLYL